MTLVLDYTSILAIGSLFFLLAGALIYYFGTLVCDRIVIEYGELGLVRKYDKIKYYKYGAIFLEECIFFTFIVGTAIFFLLGIPYTVLRTYYPINVPNIINNDGKVIQLITILDFIFLLLQFYVLDRSNRQIKGCELKNVKYSQKSHNKCLSSSSIPIFSSIIVSTFIITIVYTLFTSESISLHLMFMLLIIIFVFIIVPILLAFLIMANLAYLHGYFLARRNLSEFKPVDKFILYLIDDNKIEGKKLRYVNGIYTLSESAISYGKDIDYTIYEDKVHHIKRIYRSENSEDE